MELVEPIADEWAQRFAAERAMARRLLGESVPVEHIGSTALGIPAKDVVDVLVGVPAVAFEDALASLTDGGLALEGRRSCRDGGQHAWLARLDQAATRTAIVHVVTSDGAEWNDRVTFRDRLRQDAEARSAYLAIKRRAAAMTNDWTEYTALKGEFVRRVLGNDG